MSAAVIMAVPGFCLVAGMFLGYGAWWLTHPSRPPTPNGRLIALVGNAFQEGRESLSGTDRHHADRAWENSRSRRRLMEIVGQ